MARPEVSTMINGKRVITKKPELLAPAGSLEKLKIAVMYGADAVFLGGQEFGLRSNAQNFSLEEIREAVQFAAGYGSKIYVTTNIIAHNENMMGLEEYLTALGEINVAGIIVADPLIIETCKRVAPNVEVHLSTQQSTMNYMAIKFWEQEGLHRVVLARETTKDEIQDILDKTDVEIETFVHGAMCIAYSGRCTLSNHMTARDSNRGGCCQSCRWEFDLHTEENNDPKALFTPEDIKFAMSPKDLNLLQSIPEMIEMGIDSLKIEGRMKSIHYIATVVSVYRKLIDLYCENPDEFVFDEKLLFELSKCANREAAPAFFEGIPSHEEQMFNNRDEHPTQEFIGLVMNYDDENQMVTLQQRNHFRVGEVVEFFGPKIETQIMTIDQLYDESGVELDVARHPKQILKFKVPFKLYPNDMMRKHVSK
ncbi:MAG TPA: collagenase-like protease [Firmicutes bacterium]|nr:collagenase-like protease [Bacillota bacterium]